MRTTPLLAARHGKHLLIEKPMALTLDECAAIIDAARSAGVHLVVGHSHSFDAPVRRLRALIESGEFGAVRMINAIDYTDYLYRPRRPEELDTAQGGGAVFNQAAHQVDIVRLIGGGQVTSVRAATGAWDRGAADRRRLCGAAHLCERRIRLAHLQRLRPFRLGRVSRLDRRDGAAEKALRRCRRGHASRARRKRPRSRARAITAAPTIGRPWAQAAAHQHFGTLLVSCERADLRALPNGVMIYQNGAARLEALPPPAVPRAEVIDELYRAVVHGEAPLHDGAWAMATLEVVLANPALRARRPRRDASAIKSACHEARRRPSTQSILRHWREAVPDDRLAHLVKDATRALWCAHCRCGWPSTRSRSAIGPSCAFCGKATG